MIAQQFGVLGALQRVQLGLRSGWFWLVGLDNEGRHQRCSQVHSWNPFWVLGWPPEAGAKMSGKCSREKKKKTKPPHTNKGESGLLEVSKENGVDQIHITL